VVEESITSERREEEEVHHTVEDSFKSLREDRLYTWLRAKTKGMKEVLGIEAKNKNFLAT
jgi:hypothetical protein